MLMNYKAGPGKTGHTTKDLTTGIADWKLDNRSEPWKTEPNPAWYVPKGELQGKWLGNAFTGVAKQVYTYTLSFEVNPPPFPASNLESPIQCVGYSPCTCR